MTRTGSQRLSAWQLAHRLAKHRSGRNAPRRPPPTGPCRGAAHGPLEPLLVVDEVQSAGARILRSGLRVKDDAHPCECMLVQGLHGAGVRCTVATCEQPGPGRFPATGREYFKKASCMSTGWWQKARHLLLAATAHPPVV